ncbi:Uncharacterised protein [Acholeplasma oculi]|uniref:Phage protein L2_11 of Acholeplasma phage L2 n=1 Tax=Acholeplasma oculi TaxID=35623 RepID=A0A061AGH3_9MOLU|nr:hypothetical protein [Acholeplasma oculi]CDR30661.1 Phage protein L2_11 of Acholeplasma phage L2 [Acholeplasma oculi]SKC34615.1 hypothetical protein SAMN02745122_0014 [Acholeplasma oculi]SUT89428.1 Uncharacterised protein [Acholeplasma oculi]SUU69845.1 Uncharacterised protein [Acholeplasma oculi]
MKTTRPEALEKLSWKEILRLLVSKEEYALMENDVRKFMSYNHKVSPGILNAVMMKAIITAKRVHGEHTTINIEYLRITFESFVFNKHKSTHTHKKSQSLDTDNERKYMVRNVHQAVAKLDKEMNDLRQKGIVTSVKENPDFVNTYLEELKALEEKHYLQSNTN